MNVPQYIEYLKGLDLPVWFPMTFGEVKKITGVTIKEQVEEYVDEFLRIYEEKREWCHIIVKQDFFPLIVNHPQYRHSGISCACECNVVLRGRHFHLIGEWNYPKRSIVRLFAAWREHLGKTITKGSNLDYIIKPLHTFQHFLATFFYVTCEQRIFKLGEFGRKIKHNGFRPFGLTEFATLSKDIPPKAKWAEIHGCLQRKGYKEESFNAVREYEAFVEERRRKKADIALKGDQTRYILAATKRLEKSADVGGGQRAALAAVMSARAGVAPATPENYYPLGKCDEECQNGWIIETRDEGPICKRHPCLPPLSSLHIPDPGLLQFASNPHPDLGVARTLKRKATFNPAYIAALRKYQKEDPSISGEEQQREEFPSEEFESTRL